MMTAPLKKVRYEVVPVLASKPGMFAILANAAVKRTNHTIGCTREKKRNGGRRKVFLIHRPAMLPTSPKNSPAVIYIGLRRRAPHGVRRCGVTSSARLLRPVYLILDVY